MTLLWYYVLKRWNELLEGKTQQRISPLATLPLAMTQTFSDDIKQMPLLSSVKVQMPLLLSVKVPAVSKCGGTLLWIRTHGNKFLKLKGMTCSSIFQ